MLKRGERELALVLGTVGCHEPVAVVLVPESITNPELMMEILEEADNYGQEVSCLEIYRVSEPDQVLALLRQLNEEESADAAQDEEPLRGQ